MNEGLEYTTPDKRGPLPSLCIVLNMLLVLSTCSEILLLMFSFRI